VVWRTKQEFSQGSGSAKLLQQYFEEHIDDNELAQIQDEYPIVRSKEECHYFNIFVQHFGDSWAVKTVGQWITC
jgi:asparagine synthase (glutamine-hydrolysing)